MTTAEAPEKGEGSKKEEAGDLIDEIINSGPPLVNSGKPNQQVL